MDDTAYQHEELKFAMKGMLKHGTELKDDGVNPNVVREVDRMRDMMSVVVVVLPATDIEAGDTTTEVQKVIEIARVGTQIVFVFGLNGDVVDG